jgi:NADH dehydrogenase
MCHAQRFYSSLYPQRPTNQVVERHVDRLGGRVPAYAGIDEEHLMAASRARTDERRRIVIIGGGFGGAYCAQALARKLRRSNAEVLLIDRNNYFVFYPLLVEAGTGRLQPSQAVVATRAFAPHSEFRMADVVAIDPVSQTVRYRLPEVGTLESTGYDHLVLAAGSVTNLPPVPGLREHGFGIKSIADAVTLRNRAIRMLEVADATDDPKVRRALLHFVVVGGNFTGVEVAGEFLSFLRQATRRYKRIDPGDVRVTLVEITERVLPALDTDLSEYAAERMQRCGVTLRLSDSVARIERDRVLLTSGEILHTHTTIWCAGIAPNPLLENLPLPKDERGYVSTNDDLRVAGYDNVWAIGDCAANPGPDGKAYPATAQHAVQQAAHAAANIARVLSGRGTRPCQAASKGSIAAIGCRTGVAKIFGIKLSGFFAWWLYRTVYLLKMPGLARKVRLALDWTLDLLFPRDHVQFEVQRPDVQRAPLAPSVDLSGRQSPGRAVPQAAGHSSDHAAAVAEPTAP